MKKQKKVTVHSFRKRSHSNPSISQLLTVACYKKHIKKLIANNRKLAAELASTRVQNGFLNQQVKDLNNNHHYVKYARLKVTEIANSFSKCVTDIAEVIQYLDQSSTPGVNFFHENVPSTEKLMVKIPLLNTLEEVSVSSPENIIKSKCSQAYDDQKSSDEGSENHCSTSENNANLNNEIAMSPQTSPSEASENHCASSENVIGSRNKIELPPILFVEEPEVKNKKKSSKDKTLKNSQNVDQGSLTPILDIDMDDLNMFSRRKTSSRRETKHFSFPKVRGSSKEINGVPHIPNLAPLSPVSAIVVFPAPMQNEEGSDQINEAQRKINKSSKSGSEGQQSVKCSAQQSFVQNLKCSSPGASNPTGNNTASSDASADLPTEHAKEVVINTTVNQSEDMELTDVIHHNIPITLHCAVPTEERKDLHCQADNNVPQDISMNSSCEKGVAPSVNNHKELSSNSTPHIDRPKRKQKVITALCFSSDDDSFHATPRKSKGVKDSKSKGLYNTTTDRLSLKKSKDVYELDVSDSKMKKRQKSKTSRSKKDTLSLCLANAAKKKIANRRAADQQLHDARKSLSSLNKHAEKRESNIRLSSSLKHPDTPRSSSKRVSFANTDQILMFTDKNIENKEVNRTSKSRKEIKEVADQVAIVAQGENFDFSGDTELYQFPLVAGVNSGADNLQLTSKLVASTFSEKPKARLVSKSSNKIKAAADPIAIMAHGENSDFDCDTELYQFPLIGGTNSGADNLHLISKSVVATFSEKLKVKHASKFSDEMKETTNPVVMMIPAENSDFSGDTELYQFCSKSVVSAFSEKSKNDPNCMKNNHISQKLQISKNPTEEDLNFYGDKELCTLPFNTMIDTAQSSSQPTITNVAKKAKSERCDKKRSQISKIQQTSGTQSSESITKNTNAGVANSSEVTEGKVSGKASSRCQVNAVSFEPSNKFVSSLVVADKPKDKKNGKEMDFGPKKPKKTTQNQVLQNIDLRKTALKKGTYSSTGEAITSNFSDKTGEHVFHPDADNFLLSSKCISETSRKSQRHIKRKESLSVVKNKISTKEESLCTVEKKRDDLKENTVTSDHQNINDAEVNLSKVSKKLSAVLSSDNALKRKQSSLEAVPEISENCAIDCSTFGKCVESSPVLKDVLNLIEGAQNRISLRRKTKSVNYKEPSMMKKMRRE